MSKISNKTLENPYIGKTEHKKYLYRIKKTLYYGKFRKTDRLSLPVTDYVSLPMTQLLQEESNTWRISLRVGHPCVFNNCLQLTNCLNDTETKNVCVFLQHCRDPWSGEELSELAAELFSEAHRGKTLERLHYNDAATISHKACVSPCSLVLAILYLERLKTCNPEYLEKTVPSDLFLVSLMVSSKFLFDYGVYEEVYIDKWAASGQLTVKELVKLEKDFLNAIDWKVYVDEVSFWKKLNEVELSVASKQACTRGFFTYTELDLLLRTIDLQSFVQIVSAITLISAMAYTLGIVIVAGSVFLASHIPGTTLQMMRIGGDDPDMLMKQPESTVITDLGSSPQHEVKLKEIESLLKDIDEFKTEIETTQDENNNNCSDRTHKCTLRNIDALKVLKTGIFLASIKPASSWYNESETLSDEYCLENSSQCITWDWWTVPIMNWIYNVSKAVDTITSLPVLRYFTFLETSATSMKTFELEDQINKATKTRIQDQMETSWHKEWIESILFGLFYNYRPNAYTITNLD